MAVVVCVAVYLEAYFKVFRALSAALVGILLALILSNVGLIPGESRAYDYLIYPGASLGIVLILLSVDLQTVIKAGPKMLAAFGLGSLGTAIGAFASGLVLAPQLGPETWKLAGQFTGTYTGGSVNFAALGQAFDTSSEMFSAAIAADVLLTALWMMLCLILPLLLGFRKEMATEAPAKGRDSLQKTLYRTRRAMHLKDATLLMLIAVGCVWGAERLGALVPQLPDVLWLTTLALLLAQIPQIKHLAGAAMWGYFLLLLFLATVGAQSVVANIIAVGPSVLYFAIGTVAFHGIVLFGLGALFRIDLRTLLVASQANVGGPSSALALATARGYTDRLLPGVAVGLLGYAVGNYAGFGVAALVRGLI